MPSKIAFLICLIGVINSACGDKKTPDTKPDVGPEIDLTAEEQTRQELLTKQGKTKAYLTQSPAFLDAAIDQRCTVMEAFLKQFQIQVFPEITLTDAICKDKSFLSALNYEVNFQVHHQNQTAILEFACSQFSSETEWFCRTDIDDPEIFKKVSFIQSFYVELWDLSHAYGKVPQTKEARIYDRSYKDFVQRIAQKTETTGIDYQQFKSAKGFQKGDTVLTFSLIADMDGDGTRGKVEFTKVPQIWFDFKVNGPGENHLLLDCPDLECLRDTRYEIRAQQFNLYREVRNMRYFLPYSFDANIFGDSI